MDLESQLRVCELIEGTLNKEIQKLIGLISKLRHTETEGAHHFLKMCYSCNQIATQEARIMLKEIRDELEKFE
jgi:hypothetical protein